jgi:hypothetical protein
MSLLRLPLTGYTREANNYGQYIRQYNSAMAFGPMGTQMESPDGNCPYCFRVHVQIYHFVSPLYLNKVNKQGTDNFMF